MMKQFIALARSEDGTSIVEMGFAAPILSLLLIGMVDMSRAYSAKLQLEQVAQRTIEKVQNADYVESADYKTALKAEAAAAAEVSTTAVTINSWTECNNNGTKLAFTTSCSNVDDPYARYVEVSIDKTYTPMFKTRFAGARADGTYNLTGKAGVRIQ
jgi:Flp pilus assembly protein TadG